MLAPDTFVSLADWLAPRPAAAIVEEPVAMSLIVEPSPPALVVVDPGPLVDIARELRVFRATLKEAAAVARTALISEIAVAVLGRELQLEPAALDDIVVRIIAERRTDEPLRVRVGPFDAAIACALPVVIDPNLLPGDAILECVAGGVDATLGVRLADVLAAFA